VRLLGQVEIEVDGRPFQLATPRKSLQVLAYLLLHRAGSVPRDHLAFLLWPDEEEGVARARLRSTINDMLRILPQPHGDFVRTNTETIWWNSTVDLWLDVDAFLAASKEPARLEEAVAYYRGELLPGLYDEWLYGFRDTLQNVYLADLTSLVSQKRRHGDLAAALDFARAILAVDPWREDIVRRVMSLRYEAADAAGALHEYRDFSQRLRGEMGVAPMIETSALAERIAAGGEIEEDEAAAPPPARRRDAASTLPFVGRSREMARLLELWSRSKQRSGSIAFIGGEPGIGKSRLVREFIQTVEDEGGRAIYGATGSPEAFPYQSIIESLRAALPLVAALDLGPTWFAALATVLPDLTPRIASLATLPPLAGDAQRQRLFEALGRAFVNLARPRPLLVVLEDLHWASQSTVDALADLARRTGGARVLFLITFRDNEADASHPLRRLQRQAEIERGASSIVVLPLDVDSVGEILESVSASEEESRDPAALHERSGGNPLFLTQLLEAAAPQKGVPPTIASLVEVQVARLSPEARAVAEIAALAGQRFSPEVVKEVAGFGDAATAEALDELLDRRIVHEATGRSILAYTFAHQLVQDAISQLADESRVVERSRRMARALGRLYPERSRELAAQIAGLLDSARQPEEAALQYAFAAESALDVGAVDDALKHVERGLALTKSASSIASMLRVRQGAHERAGDLAAELADLGALSSIADDSHDDELACVVLLRRARIVVEYPPDLRQAVPEAAPVLAELRERADRMKSIRWRADADHIDSLIEGESIDRARAVVLAESALNGYRALGNRAGMASALATIAMLSIYSGRAADASATVEQALHEASASGDYRANLRALHAAVAIAIFTADSDRVVALAQRYVDLAVHAGDRRNEGVALTQTTWPILWTPDFLRALPILERAAELCNVGLFSVWREGSTALFSVKLGEFESAARALEGSVSTYRRSGTKRPEAAAQSTLAFLLGHLGEHDRALRMGREALRILSKSGYVPSHANALLHLAEAEYCGGEVAAAIGHLEEAWPLRNLLGASLGASHEAPLLAAFCAEAEDVRRAISYAEQVPTGERELSLGVYWPQRSAWCVAYAYHAADDEAAASRWLHRAVDLYEAHLPYLADEQSATFERLPWHRALLAARAGEWPRNVWTTL
jgi:DNA-binding SARP family transcriptional activator